MTELEIDMKSVIQIAGLMLINGAVHRGFGVDLSDWPFYLSMLGAYLFAAPEGPSVTRTPT